MIMEEKGFKHIENLCICMLEPKSLNLEISQKLKDGEITKEEVMQNDDLKIENNFSS